MFSTMGHLNHALAIDSLCWDLYHVLLILTVCDTPLGICIILAACNHKYVGAIVAASPACASQVNSQSGVRHPSPLKAERELRTAKVCLPAGL